MATATTVAAALKKIYYGSASTIPDLTAGVGPLWSKIEKKQWKGEDFTAPVKLSHNAGGSANFTVALANAGSLNIKRWVVPTNASKKHYALATIPGDVIAMMDGGTDGSYFTSVVGETDSAFKASARKMSLDLYRDGWGAIGVVASISSATATLVTAGDAKLMEPGQWHVFSSSLNAAVLRGAAPNHRLQVLSVDIDAGTVTYTANMSTVTGGTGTVANADTIFIEGDREDSATPTARRINGLEKLIPYVRTGLSTALYGVDRSLYANRLAGRYLDGSGKRINESLMEMAAMLGDTNPPDEAPDVVTMSWTNWALLAKELGSNVTYGNMENPAGIGFRAIKINAGNKSVDVVQDNCCPDNRIYMLNTSTFKLLHLGAVGPIRLLDEDESKMLRQGSADTYEIRIGGYNEMVCLDPGANGVINV